MQLTADLIRDTLLFSESLPRGGVTKDSDIFENEYMKNYSRDEVIHAIETLGDSDARLINGKVRYASNKPFWFFVGSPTFEGQQYLNDIRDNKIWEKVKKKIGGITTVSLPIIQQVAISIVKNELGL